MEKREGGYDQIDTQIETHLVNMLLPSNLIILPSHSLQNDPSTPGPLQINKVTLVAIPASYRC